MDQDLKRAAALVVPYAFFCSVLAGHFYWGFIEVNAFDFVSLDGVITQSIPVFVVAGFALVPIWLWELWVPERVYLPTDDHARAKYFKYATILSGPLILAALVLAHLKFYKYPFCYAAITIALIACAVILARAPIVKRYFSSQPVALAVSFIFLCLPAAMTWGAAERASRILNGADSTYVEASNLREMGMFQPTQKLIYYGKLGELLFFKSGDSIVALPSSAFTRLEFRRFGEPEAASNTKE